jgi:predicted 2-oxoglutarate/Fe(II)-dependent dioxygenase YbiX
MINDVMIVDNFLDQQSCKLYVNYLKKTDYWEKNGDDSWNDRSINLSTMTKEHLESMLDLRIKVKEKIIDFFNLSKPLYSDIFQFVRWRIGDNLLPPHADAEFPDGTYHPFNYRNFASIIYLNDDFEGGEIFFPEKNIKPKIKVGTLVSFPGTLEFLHGVSTVTTGTRYTIAGFFTFNDIYHDGRRI